MDPVIDDILTRLKAKYGVTKFDLEKIMDSEFKVLLDNIQSKGLKKVKLIHLGTVSPSKWFIENHGKYHKEDTRDIRGSQELPIGE